MYNLIIYRITFLFENATVQNNYQLVATASFTRVTTSLLLYFYCALRFWGCVYLGYIQNSLDQKLHPFIYEDI
jgi:hypothetical protein